MFIEQQQPTMSNNRISTDLLLVDPMDHYHRSRQRPNPPADSFRDEERKAGTLRSKKGQEEDIGNSNTSSTNPYWILIPVMMLVVVFLVGILFGYVLFELTSNNNNHSHATEAPESVRSADLELEPSAWSFFPEATRQAITNDPSSPQAKAWEWLQEHPDYNNGTMATWRQEQLMGLGTFFYATGGDDDSWGNVVQLPRTNSLGLGNRYWMDHSTHECYWRYSGCADGEHLTTLNMPDGIPGLAGSLPPEIGLWTSLQYLRISENTGLADSTLPTEIGQLIALKHLELNTLGLRGWLPTTLGELTALTHLTLQFNSFDGPIITEIGNLDQLTWLSLSDNQFQGNLPSQLGSLTELTWLALQNNRLSGPISGMGTWGNMQKLQALDLTQNQLTGWVPIVICMPSTVPFLEYVLVDCDKVVCPTNCPDNCGC